MFNSISSTAFNVLIKILRDYQVSNPSTILYQSNVISLLFSSKSFMNSDMPQLVNLSDNQ